MSGPALAPTKTRLTVSSNDANRHEGTIITYAKVISHLLKRYDADTVISKADEEIRNFKQALSTP